MNSILAGLPVTIFEVMSQLARDHAAINLGQGFPDDPGPEDVRRKAAEAVLDGYNQYPSMMGTPELREAIAAHYRRWQGLALDPASEVMVTSGATEALAASLFGLIEPGDEVVVFQPFYDAYVPLIRRAGGVPRFARLRPPDWRLTEEELRRVFSPKTKLVVFNNPLNPAAIVYPREDLELLDHLAAVRHAVHAQLDVVPAGQVTLEHLVIPAVGLEPHGQHRSHTGNGPEHGIHRHVTRHPSENSHGRPIFQRGQQNGAADAGGRRVANARNQREDRIEADAELGAGDSENVVEPVGDEG